VSDSREAFEEAAARLGFDLLMRNTESEDSEYYYSRTQDAWNLWQEACDWQARAQGDAEPVAWWDGDLGEISASFEVNQTAYHTIPVYTHPPKVQAGAWKAEEGDYNHSIHTNPDAKAWAEFFMETFPKCGADPDIIHGWFANAMMAMHDHVYNKAEAKSQAVPEGWKLVPIEPTIDMVEMGGSKAMRGMDFERAQAVWKEMLRWSPKAPKPPEQEQES